MMEILLFLSATAAALCSIGTDLFYRRVNKLLKKDMEDFLDTYASDGKDIPHYTPETLIESIRKAYAKAAENNEEDDYLHDYYGAISRIEGIIEAFGLSKKHSNFASLAEAAMEIHAKLIKKQVTAQMLHKQRKAEKA